MQDFFFDTPWLVLAGLAVVGVALFIVGNNRTDATLRNVGIGVFVLGILLFLTSWLIDTSKEKCIKNTRELVRAVQDRDWATFDKLVSPRCTVRVPLAGAIYQTGKQLRDATEIAVDKYGLKSNSIMGTDAVDTGDFIKVGVNVLSDGTAYPLTTSWEMEWQDTNSGWQLTDLTAIKIANESGAAMKHNFPNAH
ncbi:hypothetical protein BH10PLA1_BH10PLA1_22250 [soil metagenome]